MERPKMEKGSVIEKVSVEADVTLMLDLERYSSGLIHGGFELGTFNDGKDSIVAGGSTIAVRVNGRTWSIPLGTLAEMAIQADKQREERLANW